jgi:hypothetical protein
MSEEKKVKLYSINGKEYKLKDRYTLKDWGGILKIISPLDVKNNVSSLVMLLTENKFVELLNLVLDKKVSDEIYEEDFDTVAEIVNDFFSRKESLTKNAKGSLKN